MQSAVSELEAVQLEPALADAAKLLEQKDPVGQLRSLGRLRGADAASAVKNLIPSVNTFLEHLNAQVTVLTQDLGQSAKDVQEYQSHIRTSLNRIAQDLNVLGGSGDDAD